MEYQILDNSEFVSGKVPLTSDEKALLLYIYKKRLTFLLSVLFGLVMLNLYFDYRTGSLMASVAFIPGELIMLICLAGTFYKRIFSFRTDYKNGVKEKVYYQIVQKQFMEHTNQYFIGLNNPKHLFQEVDKDTWGRCNVGDSFIVYRTPKAKYYFNPRGAFEII